MPSGYANAADDRRAEASTQWLAKMETVGGPAIAAVERGDIQIVPENRRQDISTGEEHPGLDALAQLLWASNSGVYCEDCKQVNGRWMIPRSA